MKYQEHGGLPGNRYLVHYDEGRIEPNSAGYSELHSTIEAALGETVWLLTVGYTTGDSYGQDPETYHEYVDIYRSYDEAAYMAKAIRAHNDRTKGFLKKSTGEESYVMPIRFGNGVTKNMHLPWGGYFESIEFIEVTEVIVGQSSRKRF